MVKKTKPKTTQQKWAETIQYTTKMKKPIEGLTLYVPNVTADQYMADVHNVKVWERATPGAPPVLVSDARHIDEDCYSIAPLNHPFAESLRSWMQGEKGYDEGWGDKW